MEPVTRDDPMGALQARFWRRMNRLFPLIPEKRTGDVKNNGREWRPKASPETVNVHDFIDPKLGRAVPYGIYDIGDNNGWVSVGIDHDTASFAVHALHRWGLTMDRTAIQRLRARW